jgi:precorrin-3B methylase
MNESIENHSSVWPADIAVVGLGIKGAHQITREVEEVIRRSERTFVVASGYGIADYLRTLCPNVEDLGLLYEPGRNRMLTYCKMAAEVIVAGLRTPPVCLATYGHPWVYCYPTTLIQRAAAYLDLNVQVFPGVSAFDTLLVDLGIDLAFDGIQMYEATDLLLRRRPLQSDVTCVIWQATIVGDPTYPDALPEVEQFQPLQAHLMRFYPPDHQIAMVMSNTFPLLRSVVQRFALQDLAVELQRAPQVGTLYIRPVSSRPIEDGELLERMVAIEPRGAGSAESATPPRPGRPVIGPQPG